MNIVIDNILYDVPMGELNKELIEGRYPGMLQGDTLNLDTLSIDSEEKYQAVKYTFDLICNSLTALNEEPEIKSICKIMPAQDNMIMLFAKKKRYDVAFSEMKKFMVEMLTLHESMKIKDQVK